MTEIKIRIKKTAVVSILVVLLIGIGLVVSYFVFRATREDVDEGRSEEALQKELEQIPGAVTVKKVALVGQEFLFESDIHKYAYIRGEYVDDIDREKAIEDLVYQSSLLQAAEEEGWIELNDEVFNNPFKDFDRRYELIVQVKSEFYGYPDNPFQSMKEMVDEFKDNNTVELYEE